MVTEHKEERVRRLNGPCQAVFLDVDGTLTSTLCWREIHEGLGTLEVANTNRDRYLNGDITYDEWAGLDSALWYNKSYAAAVASLRPAELVKGVSEGVKLLSARGMKIVLLSGGIDINNDVISEMLPVDDAFANILLHDGDDIKGIEAIVGYDDELSKGHIMSEYCLKHGLDISSVVHVGDSENDITGFQAAGMGIAFNAKHEGTRDAADVIVDTGDFRDVAQVILGEE